MTTTRENCFLIRSAKAITSSLPLNANRLYSIISTELWPLPVKGFLVCDEAPPNVKVLWDDALGDVGEASLPSIRPFTADAAASVSIVSCGGPPPPPPPTVPPPAMEDWDTDGSSCDMDIIESSTAAPPSKLFT